MATRVFTELAGPFGVVRGGYGGRVVGEHFLLGGGGFGVANQAPLGRAKPNQKPQRVALGAGGFYGAFMPLPESRVQPVAGVFLGVANASYQLTDKTPFPTAKAFVAAPELGIAARLSDMVHLDVSASYRFEEGSPLAETVTRDVTGLSGAASISIGRR